MQVILDFCIVAIISFACNDNLKIIAILHSYHDGQCLSLASKKYVVGLLFDKKSTNS